MWHFHAKFVVFTFLKLNKTLMLDKHKIKSFGPNPDEKAKVMLMLMLMFMLMLMLMLKLYNIVCPGWFGSSLIEAFISTHLFLASKLIQDGILVTTKDIKDITPELDTRSPHRIIIWSSCKAEIFSQIWVSLCLSLCLSVSVYQ